MQALLLEMAVYAVKHQCFHFSNIPQKDSGRRMLSRLVESGYVGEDNSINYMKFPPLDLEALQRRRMVDEAQKAIEGGNRCDNRRKN
ncbi:MAG: hypothetical protein V1875_02175 [Candidatus Altiarchaeota archaeon]